MTAGFYAFYSYFAWYPFRFLHPLLGLSAACLPFLGAWLFSLKSQRAIGYCTAILICYNVVRVLQGDNIMIWIINMSDIPGEGWAANLWYVGADATTHAIHYGQFGRVQVVVFLLHAAIAGAALWFASIKAKAWDANAQGVDGPSPKATA